MGQSQGQVEAHLIGQSIREGGEARAAVLGVADTTLTQACLLDDTQLDFFAVV